MANGLKMVFASFVQLVINEYLYNVKPIYLTIMDKSIYKSLAAINKAVKAIGKESRNQQQNFNFRGIDAVMNELHDLFSENNVFIVPEVLEYTVATETTAKGGKLFFTRARIKHHFVAEDGSEVVTTTVGEAMDTCDKGMNKAMSIALKYALLQMFLIPTKEEKDPDGKSWEVVSTNSQQVDPSTLAEALRGISNAKNYDKLKGLWEYYGKMFPSLIASGSEFYNAWIAKYNELQSQQKE